MEEKVEKMEKNAVAIEKQNRIAQMIWCGFLTIPLIILTITWYLREEYSAAVISFAASILFICVEIIIYRDYRELKRS